MPYTFVPKEKHAKAYIMYPISTKSAMVVCNAVKKKPLVRARRLLEDLHEQRRSLQGKYYSKAVEYMIEALKSCEKNAEALGLDSGRLMVHMSAHHGPIMRRKRRKGNWGNLLKRTYIEVMLIESGKVAVRKTPKTKSEQKNEKEAKHETHEKQKVDHKNEEHKKEHDSKKVENKEKTGD